MLDLWTEASRDLEAEHAAERMAGAKVAVAGLWPFLSLAQSEPEFEHRLALAAEHIADRVPAEMIEQLFTGLRRDFKIAKDAEGEDDADDEDGDGKPDWLQKKISGEAAYLHRGTGEWRTAAEPAPAKPQFWHAGARRWVTAEVEDHPGGGNPHYFDGGPEGGPNTGQTNQFPAHPTGGDPIDPLNQMFPMQPSPWTSGPEWVEYPMNLGPNQPGQRQAASRPEHYSDADHYAERGEEDAMRHLDAGRHYADEEDRPTPGDVPAIMQGHYHRGYGDWLERNGARRSAVEAGEKRSCQSCTGQLTWVGNGNGWRHTGKNSWLLDDDHQPLPISKRAGGNPDYFNGGPEGVAGDSSGFPPDVAQGVDPDDRVNEFYGQTPVDGGQVNNGYHLGSTPHNPAPDSDKLLGTDFDSPQEAERWGKAERGEQQDSRDSTATVGVRHTGMGEAFGEDNPYGGDGGGAQNNVPTAPNPVTTPPRQMPGGAGGDPMGGDSAGGVDTDASDRASKQQQTQARRVHGESREIQTEDDPTGYGDEYEHNIYERGGGPLSTHPRQDPAHRNVNTPQRAREPIPTTSSPGPGREEDDDRREASLMAMAFARRLVGAR